MGFFSDITPNEISSGPSAIAAVTGIGFLAAGPAGASLGALGASEVGQYKQAKKIARAQRRMADIIQQREILQTVRQARKLRAEVVASGVNSGAGTRSSAVQGGISSIESQLGSGIQNIKELGALQNTINRAQQKGALYGAIGDLAGNIFSATGGFQNIFASNPPTTTDSAYGPYSSGYKFPNG